MKIYSSALRGNCSELTPLKSLCSVVRKQSAAATKRRNLSFAPFVLFCSRLFNTHGPDIGAIDPHDGVVLHRRLLRFDDDDRIHATVPVIFSGGIGWIV